MSPARTARTAGLGLLAALMLTGCISVLPKSKPARLYRFGPAEAAATAPAPTDASRPVVGLGSVTFGSAADTDRILTVTGQDAAYIDGARWVSPARVLFQEGLTQTFETASGAPMLVRSAAALRAQQMLSLNVEAFEARYDQGSGAPPLVVVRVHATLVSNQTHAVTADKILTAQARASDNRQGPIVAAFQAAVQDVFGQLVAFTSRT